MISFDFDKWCCGCSSCASACPTSAISMVPNEEGFLMPSIDKEKCIECGKCEKVCPHLNTPEDTSSLSLNSFENKPSYLYFSNKDDRKDSASGGFVYDAMLKMLNTNGLSCGCVWDENINAVHIISNKYSDIKRMQSSKYVQSNISGCYSLIKNNLKVGKKVLFCGTPCQTAGLKQYLGSTDVSKLITICLICHGVPSPLVWNKWKQLQEKKYHGKLVDVNMRDKSFKGYSTSYCKYVFEGDKKRTIIGTPTFLKDSYLFLFTDNLFLRNSCFRCQYKGDRNGADIIVGDFYESTPSAGNMGCSCVMAMTQKGDDFVKDLDGTMLKTDFRTIGVVNPMLWTSVEYNQNRNEFFSQILSKDILNESLFTNYLPLRFKVKRFLNQIGLFNIYLNLKRKAIRLIK